MIPMSSEHITNGCWLDNVVVPLFQYYVQSAQAAPYTKVQESFMTANTILMTYQLTGSLYTDPWDMPPGCDDNNYYWCSINPLEGMGYSGICVCLAVRIMYVTTVTFPLLH